MASRVDEYRYDCSARAIATTTWAVSPDCKRPWDSARAALSDLRVAEVPEAGLIKVLKEENRD